MERGLQKTDAKIDYRYKALMDNSSQVEYGRDVLGDSFDFEESDVEGFTESGGQNAQAINGQYKINQDTAESTTNIYLAIGSLTFPTEAITTTLSIDVYYVSSVATYKVRPENNGFAPLSDGSVYTSITTSKTTYTWTLSDDTDFKGTTVLRLHFAEDTGSVVDTDIIYLDNFKVYQDLDYATHENSVSDTWDWEDSLDYFTDSAFDNTSDFNDGTTEAWGTVHFTTTNAGNEYYKAVSDFTSSSLLVVALSSSFSIDSSIYRHLTFEFNSSIAITDIQIEDGPNIVCTDSTGWSADTWYLFTCDLGLDGDWTGTETDIDIKMQGSWVNGESTVFLNMVYLYDTELGDVEGYTFDLSEYSYVKPEGILYSYATGGSYHKIFNPIGEISTSVFDTLVLEIKGVNTEQWDLRGTTPTDAEVILSTTQTFNGNWQTVTIDLFLDEDFDDYDYFKRFIIRQSTPSTGDIIEIDYWLILASEEIQQDFTVGFWDEDNEQALVNITHHFFNSTTFRWEIELYDSNQEIASYYYSDNETSADAGYPAVDSDLFVDGFTSTTSEWDTTGSSPYLGTVDGSNYIEAFNDSLIQRWFTFSDTSSDHTSNYVTNLEIYVLEGDGDDDIEWKIDTNGDNIPEYSGTLSNPTSGWYTVDLSSITIKSLINSARLSITKKVSGTNNTLKIDAAKLSIIHVSTESSSSCFNQYCRVSIDYDILQSEFKIEIKSDSGTRIFKVDWTNDFINSGSIPALFAYRKSLILYLSTHTVFYGHQEIWVDFIFAPYKEREWKEITSTADISANLIHQSASSVVFAGASAGSNNFEVEYQLVVSSLDHVSGNIITNTSDFSALVSGVGAIEFTVYNVDWNTGTLNQIIKVGIAHGFVSPNIAYQGYLQDNSGANTSNIEGLTLGTDSRMDFSISVLEDRNIIITEALYTVPEDASYFGETEKIFSNNTISDISSFSSQEFVLSIKYLMYGNLQDETIEWHGELSNFGFISKNIFDDIGNFLGGGVDFIGGLFEGLGNLIIGLFMAFLLPLFNFIADIIKVSGNVLSSAFAIVGDVLESAIQALEPLLTLITDAVDGLASWLSDIVDELVGLAAGFWDALIAVVGDVLNAFLALMADVIDAIIGVASYLLNALLDLIPFGVGDFIRDFAHLDIGVFVGQVFAFIVWVTTFSTFFLMIFFGLHMFVLPILKNLDNPGATFGDIAHNMFNFHGFDWNTGVGNLTIPIRVNAFMIWLILVIALGYLPYIWAGGVLF